MKKFAAITLIFLLTACGLYAADIKVLIAEKKNSLLVNTNGQITIQEIKNSKKYKTPKGGTFKITKADGSIIIGTLKTKKGALITPKAGAIFTINKVQYNGTLIVLPAKTGFNLIEQIDLEQYLRGVLPYEMSASWPIEALKAQAVTARTYTLKNIEANPRADFDLYSDVRSQMYKGAVKVYDSVKQAVDETKGQVLKYDNQLFYTYYHANCGGHTDPMPWVQNNPKPLSGVKCGYDKESKSYSWQYTVPLADINKYLKAQKIPGKLKSIKRGKKTSSGRAITLLITTDKGKYYTGCNAFRLAVGSTKFKSCFITNISGYKFNGRGYGHGAGMCQDGAKGMAQAGKSYKEILKHYYPSSKLTEI